MGKLEQDIFKKVKTKVRDEKYVSKLKESVNNAEDEANAVLDAVETLLLDRYFYLSILNDSDRPVVSHIDAHMKMRHDEFL